MTPEKRQEDVPGTHDPMPGGSRRVMRWSILFCLLAGMALCFYFMAEAPPAVRAMLWFHYGMRIVLVVLALAAWFLSQALIGSRGLRAGELGDGLHEFTAPGHRFLQEHPDVANAVLIISSAFIDLFGIFLIGVGIFGASLRPLVALFIVFIFRQVSQVLCALPAPPGMIWRYPGFPSLLVTYSVANEFFISGHTAIAVLGAIEAVHLFSGWVGAAACGVACLEAAVVIVLRAHYTMDVLGAAAAAWCAAHLAGLLCTVM